MAVTLWTVVPAAASDLQPILGTNERVHLTSALAFMNMTEADFGFDKDRGKPIFALGNVRKLLDQPLGLPEVADRTLAVVRMDQPAATWLLAADWLELEIPSLGPFSGPVNPPVRGQTDFVDVFAASAGVIDQSLKQAYAAVKEADLRYAAAAFLAGTFNAEDRAQARADLLTAGVSSQDVVRAIEEGMALDPEPASTNFLAILRRLDLAGVLGAGQAFEELVHEFAAGCVGRTDWPAAPVRVETPAGVVYVGSTNDDSYAAPALLIVEPGGDDTYSGDAGSANGLRGQRLAAIVDLGGNDRYVGDRMIGPGGAVAGTVVILDAAGNDLYSAGYMGQGGAFAGTAWLEDRDGDDVYRAGAHAQAAGSFGFGYLCDADGNDVYDVGLSGQGYAGVLGVGLLVDRRGHDRYLAGGREPDYERHDDRFVSLAQGFAIGMRPYAGGGYAALVDLEGNDSYAADIFGQGASYWYSVGLLLDASGNDTYDVFQYGQGSGIHLSAGLLADGGGNDRYAGSILVQGNAHDFGVGMLFDRGGDDTYTADQHAQGRGMNNALAVLLDSAGDDAYYARLNDQCQGIGNDGGKREYGSLALLMDLAGRDAYTCGATNGCRLLRPDFGIVYDVNRE